mgnify:FL=1
MNDNKQQIAEAINELIIALRLGRKIDISSKKEMTYQSISERLNLAIKFFKKYREMNK